MKLPAHFALRARLTAIVVLVIALVLLPAMYAAGLYLERQARSESEQHLVATNRLVVDLIASQYDALDATLERLGTAVEAYFSGRVGSNRAREGRGGAPAFSGDGPPLLVASEALEAFASGAHDVIASIYLHSLDDTFISVASSARVGDEPLVGDALTPPPDALNALRTGAAWRGTLRVEERMRLVRLLPFSSGRGELLGFYLIGLDLADQLRELREHLGAFRIGESGYIFVIDAAAGPSYGQAIVHPAKQGVNLLTDAGELGRQVAGEMLMKRRGVLAYDWRNVELGEEAYRRKIAAYSTLERVDWLIGVSGYEDEFNRGTMALRTRLVTALVVLAVLLVFGLNLAIGRLVISPMLRLQRTLRTLSRGNETLVHSADEPALLHGICDVLVRTGGFPFARIALCDAAGRLVAGASAGSASQFEQRFVESGGVAPDDPQMRAAREGRTIHLAPIPNAHSALAIAARDAGCRALAAFPLRDGDRLLGVLTIGAVAHGDLDKAGVDLLRELAEDLAFGIAGLRTAAARRAAESALRMREQAIEASSDGVFIVDLSAGGRSLLYANPAMGRIVGTDRQALIGRNTSAFGGFSANSLALLDSALDAPVEHMLELEGHRADGEAFWCECSIAPVDDDEAAPRVVGVVKDITERKRYLRELERQAKFDTLTDLPNRALLDDRLGQQVIAARRHGRSLGVAFIDLDHFKLINDNLGHRQGDELLRAVAERLQSVLRDGDTAARQGGDEFVILMPDIGDEAHCYAILSRIREVLRVPIVIDGRDYVVTCSIGVAMCPKDGEDADTLLRHADIAMYSAKEAGRDAIRFFREDMNARLKDRVALEQALRVALERDELHLVYQPQVDAASGRVAGAEALLRWRHPELGLVPPMRFIPVTEELGLIGVIGEWVLREACRQTVAWRHAGAEDFVIAVNVSARQLADSDFPERVMAILTETGLPPHLLELELTESMLMGDVERAEAMLHKLKQIGVSLSLDDFGTGYSSFAYLRRFPIDTVKIDQSFVRDMAEGGANAESIVSAIIAMAHSLKMRVVAEGVETTSQQARLVHHGCDLLQGYLIGRPVVADDFDTRSRALVSAAE